MASLTRLNLRTRSQCARYIQFPHRTSCRCFRLYSNLESTAAAALKTDEKLSIPCECICPVCLKTTFKLEPDSTQQPSCHRCRRTFDRSSKYVDLTLSSGVRDKEYTLDKATGTTLFENPFIGFIYERGWRDQFKSSGFPGPDAEFASAMEWLSPVTGDAVMDLSCGSGLFTRRFLTCGAFTSVVAVDYSEAMLTQTQQYINAMGTQPRASLHLVRADVARMPFATGSFKAIFAGAAIHCWPNPALAVAEVSRLLQPGGVFVFSTFTRYPKELDDLFQRLGIESIKKVIGRRRRSVINYWEETSLKDTCQLVGLENFEAIRNRQYILIKVNKPV